MSSNDEECLLIDVDVTEGGRCLFATKHIIENADDTFVDVVQSVFEEHAQALLMGGRELAGRNNDEFDKHDIDPIKVKACEMLSRVKSITCRKSTMNIDLIKFLQKDKIKIKTLNSNQTPLFKNGIIIQLAPMEDKKRPANTTDTEVLEKLNIDPAMMENYMMDFTQHTKRMRTNIDAGLATVLPPHLHGIGYPALPITTLKPKKRTRKLCTSSQGCTNFALQGGVCAQHGAVLKLCSTQGCTNRSQRGGICCRHGAIMKKCIVEGCGYIVKKGGRCSRHGERCSHEGCNNVVTRGGRCDRHGIDYTIKIKLCKHEGCTSHAKKEGVCVKHGAVLKRYLYFCSHEGCESRSKKDGLCIRHGAKP